MTAITMPQRLDLGSWPYRGARKPASKRKAKITVPLAPLPTQALTVSGFRVWVEGKPVSVNSAYGNRRGGGRYLTGDANAWKLFVWAAFRMQPHRFTAAQLPLAVHCTFYGVRGDADNYAKLTLDGMKVALDIDDKHFSPVTCAVVRDVKVRGQGAEIEVRAVGAEALRAA